MTNKGYHIAKNFAGETCGHRHKLHYRAAACGRRLERIANSTRAGSMYITVSLCDEHGKFDGWTFHACPKCYKTWEQTWRKPC